MANFSKSYIHLCNINFSQLTSNLQRTRGTSLVNFGHQVKHLALNLNGWRKSDLSRKVKSNGEMVNHLKAATVYF